MTDLNSTAPCERCGDYYPITRNKDGTPRKRKHEGFCRKCVHYLSDAKWGALGLKKCVSCGDEFTLMEISQKTCSHACRTTWVGFLNLISQEWRDCLSCGLKFSVHRDSVRAECAECFTKHQHLRRLKREGREPFTPAVEKCAHCGADFLKDVPRKGYCSDECKSAAKRSRQRKKDWYYSGRRARDSKRRALKRTTQVEKINPLDVFERDGWVCHICKELTSRSRGNDARNRDPKFAELEHVVALADGGTHTWSNVACACRACNRAKHATSFGQLHLDYGPKRTWPELATPNRPARLTAC